MEHPNVKLTFSHGCFFPLPYIWSIAGCLTKIPITGLLTVQTISGRRNRNKMVPSCSDEILFKAVLIKYFSKPF